MTTAFAGTRARALLARSSAYEALTAYDDALADIDAALALARAHGDHRLEMASLRARGGDPAVALLLPTDEVADSLQQGLRLAAALGDRPAEADFTTRLVILDASRLRLTDALDRAERGVARARAASSEEAYLLALDGLKTALTYLGDTDRLAAVLDELEPLVRVRDDTWILQWVIFERSYVAAADGRLDEARRLVADALAINARSGFPAFAGYMLAHDGWFARLAGDLPAARRVGRQAVAATSAAHPWWYATPAGILAATLIEAGEPAEAETVARRGLATTSSEEPTAGRLRCLAALAVVTGDPDVVAEATRALAAVDCPPGRAWVTGADVYLLLGATEPLRARDRARVARDPVSDHVEHQLSRACRTVGRHGQVVGRALQRLGQLVGDPARVGVAVVHRPTRAGAAPAGAARAPAARSGGRAGSRGTAAAPRSAPSSC